MKQQKLKLINGTEKLFRISCKQIQTGLSTKNKSGKTFKNIPDLDKTKLNYQNLLVSLPARPGVLIIMGYKKCFYETLEVLKSDESLRYDFFRSLNGNRFQLLLNYLNNRAYSHIKIQLAEAS